MITLRRLATVLTAMVVMLLIYAGAALAQPAEKMFFVGGGGCLGGCSMNPNGTDKRALFPSSAVGGRLIELEASPDGTKLLYTHAGSTDIHMSNADGSGRTNLTNTPDADEFGATWSPDGKQIAYDRSEDAATYCLSIWKMNANGSGQVPLTPRQCPTDRDQGAMNPDWSPDGSKIVFQRRVITSSPDTYPADFNDSLYTINPDGSGQTRLTSGPDDFLPDWSPDDSKIAYQSAQTACNDTWPGYSIFTINADGSGKTRLTTSCTADDRNPQWAPAGDKIAFDRWDEESDDEGDVWTVTADGSAKANITNSPTEWEELLDWGAAPAQPVIPDQVWYDIPDLYGTDADASIEQFESPGETYGYIHMSLRAGKYNKMYVQAKPVARFARDGDWKRQTVDSYKGSNWTNYWDDSTRLDYDGYKFRLCKSKLGPDTCGKASSTIYP